MTQENIWIFIVVALAVLLSVLLYRIYIEEQHRNQIRRQFGHADKDALMESRTESVRDGREQGIRGAPLSVTRPGAAKAAAPKRQPSAPAEEMPSEKTAGNGPSDDLFAVQGDRVLTENGGGDGQKFAFVAQEVPAREREFVADKRELLLDLDDMAKEELSWFDARFDYLAYVSLREPHELHTLPRLGGERRFQIAGCTTDNRWQPAEPIPNVFYQGFIVGMQAVSRSGLASSQDLEKFGERVDEFAGKMDGALKLTDIEAFLAAARPLDEVCARVDQTIAIHLVSQGSISGSDLRAAVEENGFVLGCDGVFYLNDEAGKPLFSIVNFNNSAFTHGLLDSKSYRGFSVLFDLPNVPAGERQFDRFMDLVLSLASDLDLNLVNDKLEELSTEWLKDVRRYVLARQDEMRQIGIEPGGRLAERLFS